MKEAIKCQMESIVESINDCSSLDSPTKMALVNIVTETAAYTNGHEDKLQALTESTFKEASLLSLTNIKISENQKCIEGKIDSLKSDIKRLSDKIDRKLGCQIENTIGTVVSKSDGWLNIVYRFRGVLTTIVVIFMFLVALSPTLAEVVKHYLTISK
jgi:uncharacterized FlaG/YvyC family protein